MLSYTTAKNIKHRPMDIRFCQICQTPLKRKQLPLRMETYARFAKRVLCSSSCVIKNLARHANNRLGKSYVSKQDSDSHVSESAGVRICRGCETSLVIRQNHPTARNETKSEFAERKFCSAPCLRKYYVTKKEVVLRSKLETKLKKAARREAVTKWNQLRRRCADCGGFRTEGHSCGYDD